MGYWIASILIRIIFSMTMRTRLKGMRATRRSGGYLLACSHVSHLDPFCLGGVFSRRVGWMARIEFFRSGWTTALMKLVHAFPVHRQGVPVKAIRVALQRLERGEVVGVFPEGEIKAGADSVLRGGPIKRGVCLLAARSGKPVLPCVILGTDKLNAVGPWLPAWRARMWVACGDFIEPVTGPDRRAAREEMAKKIEQAMAALYAELKREYGLEDSIVP